MKSAAPAFNLNACDAVVQEIHTRMPFRYGNACLTSAPLLHVRVHIESASGKKAVGLAADCLPPLWFDKDPNKDFRRNVEDQLTAFQKAKEIYLLLGGTRQTAYDLWEAALPRILDEALSSGINALTASFGSSFFERAIIDALCRLEGVSFFEGLGRNLLGFDTASQLVERPVTRIWCRHTVGLTDPITRGEIPSEERLDDGLPQALEEDIEFYGLRYFKVKVSGDHEHDADRLSRMAALFAQRCHHGYSVTLDGNEQYRDLREIENLLDTLRSLPYGQEFFDSILFIEQPLHRDVALTKSAASGIAELAKLKPIIIDESDDQLDSFKRAVDIGYRGVSHKNCKGIFKSLRNRELVNSLNRKGAGRKGTSRKAGNSKNNRGRAEPVYFQTGEDLANVAVVPLQEDLASLAALGIEHAERNGHHYYRGLDHLPGEESVKALAAHSDLYEDTEGSVFLRIVDGAIDLASVANAVGYGYDCEIAFDERTPLESWSFDRLSLDRGAQ